MKKKQKNKKNSIITILPAKPYKNVNKLLQSDYFSRKKLFQTKEKNNLCKTIAEDKEEGFMSSHNAGEIKETNNIGQANYDSLFKKDDMAVLCDSSCSINVSNTKKLSNVGISDKDVNMFCQTHINYDENLDAKLLIPVRFESTNSNFLNYNLAESKNLAYLFEKEKIVTELNEDYTENPTEMLKSENVLFVENIPSYIKYEQQSGSSDNENIKDKSNDRSVMTANETVLIKKSDSVLSISKISNWKMSSSKFISNTLLYINNIPNNRISKNHSRNYPQNISVLSSSFSFLNEIENNNVNVNNNEEYSDYSPETDEFVQINSHYNIPYKMLTNENCLSNLDIMSLNFLLRFIFHKSEILSEKTTNNINYTCNIDRIFKELVIQTQNGEKKLKREFSCKNLKKFVIGSTKDDKKRHRDKALSVYKSISSQIRTLKNKTFLFN